MYPSPTSPMNNAMSIAPPPAKPKPAAKPAKEDTDNRGELSNINISMTENGCAVSCSFEPAKVDPKRDRYSQQPEDEKMSFENLDSAAAYVLKMMKSHGQDEAGETASGAQGTYKDQA